MLKPRLKLSVWIIRLFSVVSKDRDFMRAGQFFKDVIAANPAAYVGRNESARFNPENLHGRAYQQIPS